MKCATKKCRGYVTKSAHSPYCSKCRNRKWREKHPLHYSYKNLRTRAKQRGKDFTLTREEYIAFAIKTDYARLKGKTSLSLSIDRVDDTKGYHADNIAAITLRENSRKQFTKMPQWMKDEIKQAESGEISHSMKVSMGLAEEK